jgi:putative flippase GtrA
MKTLFTSPAARLHFRQMLRFGIVGSLGASVDIGTAWLLTEHGGVGKYLAGAVSMILSVTLVFCLNRYVTFRSHQADAKGQAVKFALVYGPSIVMNFALYSAFVHYGLGVSVSKALAIGIGMVWNYLFSHFFVFKKAEVGSPIALNHGS